MNEEILGSGIFAGTDDGTEMSRQEERRANDEVNAGTVTAPVDIEEALLMQVDERGRRMVMRTVNGRPTENWRAPTQAELQFLAQSPGRIVSGGLAGTSMEEDEEPAEVDSGKILGIPKWVLGVLGVAAVGAAGYFGWQKYQDMKMEEEEEKEDAALGAAEALAEDEEVGDDEDGDGTLES